MSIRELQEAVLDQGIRHTNFFEGRLLTGDDLRNQREANRAIDRRLAQAIGPGIPASSSHSFNRLSCMLRWCGRPPATMLSSAPGNNIRSRARRPSHM